MERWWAGSWQSMGEPWKLSACGRSQTQKAMWYMIPLIWSVQKIQIPKNIQEISGRQELGWDGNMEWLLMGTRFPFDLMKMSWDYIAWWWLWEVAKERCDSLLTCELDPGNWSLLTTFPFLGVFILPTVPTERVFSRNSLERAMCCWNLLESICDWTQPQPQR